MPRSPTQMVGSSGANISVSQTTAASALRRGGLVFDVRLDVLAAGLLLAFEQELHVDRQLAGGLQQALDGFDLDVDLALVVAGAARVDVVAAHFGLERRRLPLVQRIGRLHVVVAVEQERRLARRAQPFRVDQRIALAFDQFGDGHPGRAQFVDGEFGRAPDVRLVLGKRADAGNAEEGFQSFQEVGLVLLVVGHGGLPY